MTDESEINGVYHQVRVPQSERVYEVIKIDVIGVFLVENLDRGTFQRGLFIFPMLNIDVLLCLQIPNAKI